MARRSERADHGRGSIPGLQVRVDSRGRTSYRLRYRLAGRQRSLTWQYVGLAEARRKAWSALGDVARGRDPRASPTRSAPLTVRGAAARWIRARRRSWRRTTTRGYLKLLRLHVLPAFGDREARALRRTEVRAHLRELASRHPQTANGAHQVLRQLYRWLNHEQQEALGVSADPTRGLERPANPRPRDVTYTDAQLREFFTRGSPLVRLLALTGVREAEGRGLTWDEVDFERGVWTIPGHRTKKGRAHAVPLSSGVLEVLGPLRELYTVRPWGTTRPDTEYRNLGLRPHDLRRTVGDRIKAEFGEAIMHAVLGHQLALLTRTYGPTPRLRAVADALEWWSGELARIASAA